jgi:hypothetical protein
LPVRLCSRSTGADGTGVSPLIWLGLAFWFMKRDKKTFFPILILTFGFIITWFMTVNLVRYFMPIIAPLTYLSVIGYKTVSEKISNKSARIFCWGLLLVLSLYMSYGFLYSKIKNEYHRLPPMAAASRERFLETLLPTYKALKAAGSPAGRVYALYSENMYYYGKRKLIGDWFGPARNSEILNNIKDQKTVISYLKSLKASHLLVDKTRAHKYVLKRLRKIDLLKKAYEDKKAVLYLIQ